MVTVCHVSRSPQQCVFINLLLSEPLQELKLLKARFPLGGMAQGFGSGIQVLSSTPDQVSRV